MSRTPDDQFGPRDPFNEPQRSGGSSLLKWVLILVGVAVVGGVVICCGGGYWAFRMGTGQMAAEIQGDLQAEPVIVEHIGDIQSLEMNFIKTGEADGQLMAFDIQGTKGSGTVYVIPGSRMGEHAGERLVMADGQSYPLRPDDRPEPEEPQEVIVEEEEFDPADR